MLAGPAWLLASAFLHASWNALVKREREPQGAVVGVLAAALALSVPVALAFPGAGIPGRAALLWGLGAGAFEAVYFVTLGEALARATYGAVYAIARGGALVLVWPVAAAVLREPFTARSAAGAALVAVGVVLVAAAGRERASRGGIALAVACAASIAGYHVCYGLSLAAGAAPAPLFALAFAVALPPVWAQARLSGRVAAGLDRRAALRLAGAGGLATASFLLFLMGLASSGAGVALTLRNTSVVFAQLLAVALGEALPRRQLVGAALVVAGAALVAS
ncbi:MAG TPA: EamA family transporter [Anaeromyxobacter sp.]|nr:EamA family transporter [Anaeromyxobacter sp.]